MGVVPAGFTVLEVPEPAPVRPIPVRTWVEKFWHDLWLAGFVACHGFFNDPYENAAIVGSILGLRSRLDIGYYVDPTWWSKSLSPEEVKTIKDLALAEIISIFDEEDVVDAAFKREQYEAVIEALRAGGHTDAVESLELCIGGTDDRFEHRVSAAILSGPDDIMIALKRAAANDPGSSRKWWLRHFD
jgi:hypothetical protein